MDTQSSTKYAAVLAETHSKDNKSPRFTLYYVTDEMKLIGKFTFSPAGRSILFSTMLILFYLFPYGIQLVGLEAGRLLDLSFRSTTLLKTFLITDGCMTLPYFSY